MITDIESALSGNRANSETNGDARRRFNGQSNTDESDDFRSSANSFSERRRSSQQSTTSSNASRSRAASPGSSSASYSQSQLEVVQTINKCKDYYQILGVPKDASDSDIKKAYKKLALLCHPDKNSAPGAADAFKAVGTSFAILSDVQKRKQYDLYGSEEQIRRRSSHTSSRYYENEFRAYEQEISPEDLFNMFFGGGNGYPDGRFQHRRTYAGHQHHQHEANGYSVMLQMMPVIILICLSLMSSLFVSEPAFSLVRNT